MQRPRMFVLTGTAILLAVLGGQRPAQADGEDRSLKANLLGFEEVPAISSTGSGEFRARVSHDESMFEYLLSYQDLETPVIMAHIHVGQKGVAAGISVWLCQTALYPGPAGTPFCPGPSSGTVAGVATAVSVIGPSGQGVSPGEFGELLNAIRAGVAYANVHTTEHPGGEIRGQIK